MTDKEIHYDYFKNGLYKHLEWKKAINPTYKNEERYAVLYTGDEAMVLLNFLGKEQNEFTMEHDKDEFYYRFEKSQFWAGNHIIYKLRQNQ